MWKNKLFVQTFLSGSCQSGKATRHPCSFRLRKNIELIKLPLRIHILSNFDQYNSVFWTHELKYYIMYYMFVKNQIYFVI